MKSKRYDVLLSYTKDDIKTEAVRAWLFKNKLTWICYAVIAFAYMIALMIADLHGNVYGFILAAYYLIGVVLLYVQKYRVGNKVWNKLKDVPEPIDLRNIKEML